jgi:predicted aldo/keto reductase-like oxidoreductase
MGIVGMKAIAGFVQNIGGDHSEINAKAAIKWAMQNEDVHTNIPGFTSFDQIETDLSIMEDLSFTPEEKADIKVALRSPGVYCQQCRQCIPQCPAGLDIPTLMRTYMYAFGYKNLQAAKETLALANIDDIHCQDCRSCRVKCAEGFDIRAKALDAVKVRDIPEEFLI